MHSKDFTYQYEQKIDGKTKEDWEKEWELEGVIEHLHSLGWERYQWNFESEEELEEFPNCTHFAEFFSPYYHGYLRGDSKTSLKEAMEVCLNTAQRYAQCETKTGHEYITSPGYSNGLIECRFCGFHGYSPQIDTLKKQIENLEIHLRTVQEDQAKWIQNAKKHGITFNHFGKVLSMPTPKEMILVMPNHHSLKEFCVFSDEKNAQDFISEKNGYRAARITVNDKKDS